MKPFFAGIYYLILSLFMWLPFWPIRKCILKIYGVHLGKSTYIMRNVDIRKPKNLYIGDRSVVNKKCVLDGRGGCIEIENDVDIAQETIIWTLTHDIEDLNHKTIGKGVRIKNHTWVGARTTILPGLTIGAGAIVGTCSVVTKNVSDNFIIAGNPAKKIGIRNNPLSYKLNFHPWFT